jgi:hypothetical protein
VNPLLEEQPEPVGTSGNIVWLVLDDKAGSRVLRDLLHDRAMQGFKRYGKSLRSHNGRDPRADLVQELADAAFYACQMEMEGGPSFVEEVLGLLERVVASGGER